MTQSEIENKIAKLQAAINSTATPDNIKSAMITQVEKLKGEITPEPIKEKKYKRDGKLITESELMDKIERDRKAFREEDRKNNWAERDVEVLAENKEPSIAPEATPNQLQEIEPQNPEVKETAYQPQSGICQTLDTTVPASMRYDMHKAIEDVDTRVHGVDEYVAEKLGYTLGNCSLEEKNEGIKCLCDAFSAEQVDAIAVAIYNIENKGQGCIIGDQTGIGKGRIAAGMIRYAVTRGLQPIFLTEKPNLFSDFFRDIINIGSDDAVPLEIFKGYRESTKKTTKEADLDLEDLDGNPDEAEADEPLIVKIPIYKTNENYTEDIQGKKQLIPFIVNGKTSKTDIKDESGNILYKGLAANELKNIIDSGKIPAEAKFVIGTYSQFRGATDSTKMQYLLKIAHNNIVIMDESHNASGSSNTGTFLKKVLAGTQGVVFLSATFAKRPDNMPIYASKTSMSDANMTSDALVEAITKGGVALQEIVSSALVSEAQMIRRERSFEGIEVNYMYLDESQVVRGFPNLNKEQEHRAIMDSATSVIREIMQFQEKFVNKEIEKLDKIQKAEYKEVEKRKGTKDAGIDNPPVFSGIFNIINQLLFSIKAEAVAEVAIQRLKEGKKPVIAFANTMESFLNSMTNDDGTQVKDGDLVNSDFALIFEKRLNSVLRYTEKDADGNSELKMIDVNAMDMDFREAYYAIFNKIKKLSIGISSSPIDVVIDRIEKAGFSCVEVTGRDRKLKLLDGNKAMIKARTKISANDAFRQFNNNETDCLLINQSGSTGASAHALPNARTPKDKVKQRVMIILQAELNINTEVQKRGRINRTGQIYKPIYDYVISAIPAEKRLMMMLQKKLKSLDANTTSSQKQSEELMDVKQSDFLNKYGDDVVVEYLTENPLINEQIGDPLKLTDKKEGKGGGGDTVDAAHRASGRVAILTVKEQEAFYEEVSQRYVSQVEYLRQTGEYDLEVENMNLEAETLEKDVVVVGKGGESVFGRHSILEKCSINNLKKPFKKIEIDALIKEGLGNYDAGDLQKSIYDKCVNWFINQLKAEYAANDKHYADAIKNIPNEKQAKGVDDIFKYIKKRTEILEEARESMGKNIKISLDNKLNHIVRIIKSFKVGKVIGYPTVTYSQDGQYYDGIFLGLDIKESAKNPYAPSAMRLRFAIAGSLKYVAIPASKIDIINSIKAITTENIYNEDQTRIFNNWDEICSTKSTDKVIRYIVTGNILQAFGKQELKGSLISYTTNTGAVKKGILLPDSFEVNPSKGSEGKAMKITVPINAAIPIIKSLTDGGSVWTNDNVLSIIKKSNDTFRISVPASKQKGGKYFLNETLKKLMTEKTFNKVGDQMTGTLEFKKIENLIEFLQDEFNCAVDLTQSQYSIIKKDIKIEDYNDEARMPEAEVFMRELSKENEVMKKETTEPESGLKYPTIPQKVKMFMPEMQQEIVNSNIIEFQDAIENILGMVDKLPKTYETDGQGDKAIVYLHYFTGSQDWYITEQDSEPEQLQAFGLVNLFGDPELGYINIEEIKHHGQVELDFYWTPKSLAEIKGFDETEVVEADLVQEVMPALENKYKIGDRVVNIPIDLLEKYTKWDIDHNVPGGTITGFHLGKNDVPYIAKVKVDGKKKGYDSEGWSIDNISFEKAWREKAEAETPKPEIKDVANFGNKRGEKLPDVTEPEVIPEPSPNIEKERSSLEIMNAARNEKILDTKIRYNGIVMTRREFVENTINEGGHTDTKEVNKIKELSRNAYNRMDNQEQDDYEKKVKEAGKKTEYRLYSKNGTTFSDITRAEYDYAKLLEQTQHPSNIKSNDLPSPDSKQRFSNVKEIDRSEIITMPELFQGRQHAFSEESVNKIVSEGFDKSNEPIIVWYNPDVQKYVVISGHSRWEASRRLYEGGDISLQTMPVKEFLGDLGEAINYAVLESNRASTQEGLISDINAVRKMMTEGYNKTEMLKYVKPESYLKNVTNYTYLNPNGKFIEYLSQPSGSKSFPYLERNANWVGELRKQAGDRLTNLHENEIFEYIYQGSKKGLSLSKDQLYKIINDKVGKFDYDPELPLNLQNVVSTNAVTSDAVQKLNELKSEVDYWNKEISKKQDLIVRAKNEEKQELVPKFNADISAAQQKIISLKQQIVKLENDIRKIETEVVQDLFSMVDESPSMKKIEAEIVKKEATEAYKENLQEAKQDVNDCNNSIIEFEKMYDKKSVLSIGAEIEIRGIPHSVVSFDSEKIVFKTGGGRFVSSKENIPLGYDEIVELFNKGKISFDGYAAEDKILFHLMVTTKEKCVTMQESLNGYMGLAKHNINKTVKLANQVKELAGQYEDIAEKYAESQNQILQKDERERLRLEQEAEERERLRIENEAREAAEAAEIERVRLENERLKAETESAERETERLRLLKEKAEQREREIQSEIETSESGINEIEFIRDEIFVLKDLLSLADKKDRAYIKEEINVLNDLLQMHSETMQHGGLVDGHYDLEVLQDDGSWRTVNNDPLAYSQAQEMKSIYSRSRIVHHQLKMELAFGCGGEVAEITELDIIAVEQKKQGGEIEKPKRQTRAKKTPTPTVTNKTEVQAITLDKINFSKARAKAWLHKHGYKNRLEIQANSYRAKQLPPAKIKDGTWKTVPIEDGVKAITGEIKGRK